MYPAGSGYPPQIIGFSSTCDATTGTSIVEFSVNKQIYGSACDVHIEDATGQTVWGSGIGTNTNAKSFEVSAAAGGVGALPNGSYKLITDNGEASKDYDFTVSCQATSGPAGCTVALAILSTTAPTTAGGYGLVEYTLSGVIDPGGALVRMIDPQGQQAYYNIKANGTWQINALAGFYTLTAVDTKGNFDATDDCNAVETLTIPAYQAPNVPVVEPPAQWHPVGGVLPNQASLAVAVGSLSTTAGAARVGLYVEVELTKAGAAAKFGTAHRVIRTTTDTIDVSQYLRAELATVAAYPAYSGFFKDGSAGFQFSYRYREVDNDTVGQWVAPLGKHYAVLAAMPPAAQSLLPYVVTQQDPQNPTDPTGWPVAFASGDAAQVVGYPLEVALLLGVRPAGLTLWLEAQYFDGAGQLLELRNVVLADTRPAGYYRWCLPADPLPCAAYLELVVADKDRAFTGSCASPATTPGNPSTGSGGGLLLGNTGYIKL